MFRSEFFFRTTQELEYLFVLSRKARIFFSRIQHYMTKTLNQIIFFSSTKIRIFFSATLGISIFFLEKNHNPPFKLNGRSLNAQFKSVYTQEDHTNIPHKGPSPYSAMQNITITENRVYKLMRNIKRHKATGPDNIQARNLKELALELTPISPSYSKHI